MFGLVLLSVFPFPQLEQAKVAGDAKNQTSDFQLRDALFTPQLQTVFYTPTISHTATVPIIPHQRVLRQQRCTMLQYTPKRDNLSSLEAYELLETLHDSPLTHSIFGSAIGTNRSPLADNIHLWAFGNENQFKTVQA